MFCFSDPYVRIRQFRGDVESGEISTVQTKTIKKVNKIVFIAQRKTHEKWDLWRCDLWINMLEIAVSNPDLVNQIE